MMESRVRELCSPALAGMVQGVVVQIATPMLGRSDFKSSGNLSLKVVILKTTYMLLDV